MQVSLTPYLEALIRKKVDTGGYSDASEVIREALRLMEEQDRFRAIRLKRLETEIQLGLDQLERGEADEMDGAGLRGWFEDVKREGRKRMEPGVDPHDPV